MGNVLEVLPTKVLKKERGYLADFLYSVYLLLINIVMIANLTVFNLKNENEIWFLPKDLIMINLF